MEPASDLVLPFFVFILSAEAAGDWDEVTRDTTGVGLCIARGPRGVSGFCTVKVRLGGGNTIPFGVLGSGTAIA